MTRHGMVVAGLVVILALTAMSCAREAVVDSVSQEAANRAAVVLEDNGVPSSVRHDGAGAAGWSVWVDSGLVADARGLLVAHRLPAVDAELPAALEGGLLGPSPQVEHALLVQRQAAELSLTLQRFDGVLDARVHLMLPFDPWRPEPEGDAAASVLLLEHAERPASATDDAIARLVAGAVERLEVDAVTVVRVEATPTRVRQGSIVEHVGPWLVAREHASTLAWTLVGLIATTVGLAVYCGMLLFRLRRRGTSS